MIYHVPVNLKSLAKNEVVRMKQNAAFFAFKEVKALISKNCRSQNLSLIRFKRDMYENRSRDHFLRIYFLVFLHILDCRTTFAGAIFFRLFSLTMSHKHI